eukprot:5990113-Alexandrium_andersonii.AAC.1
MAREVKGRRVPVATRRSGRSGLCRRRLACGQCIALGLGVLYICGIAASAAQLVAPWDASTGHCVLLTFWLLAAWTHARRRAR